MSNKTRIVHASWLVSLILTVRKFIRRIWQDRVSVYAAQASFFTIISSVPLITLVAGIVRLIWPTSAEREKVITFFSGTVPESILEIAVQLFDEVASASAIPILSISALFIWWSAAKGVGAIREGIQTVYEAPRFCGYFRKMFSSIIYTLVFVVLILTAIALLLFGEFLLTLLHTHFPHFAIHISQFLPFRVPVFLILLSCIFTVLYTAVSRRSPLVSHRFRDHLPGGILASLGWLLFSWVYSYYMNHASRPHLLYGNLTALCLILLWLYFCMIILLCGAEINKMFFAKNP
ncbi:MAG: YihY/virulence factor BrkB family protein [Clostridia bacterium]|nr:YihY/virulence factor BrkB family protein [Clostridia bacterium]